MINGPPIALMDIGNCEAFVQRTIDRSAITYGPSEREELLSEGLTLLYELAQKYNPGVGGRDATGSRFSGYAAMFLPRRLGDAWHKAHPEHRYITDPDTGKRGWRYDHTMVSLDGLSTGEISADGYDEVDRQLLHARTITNFCHVSTLSLLSRITASPAG